MRKADSKSIINKLENEFFPRYNSGLIFIVDAGSEFTSNSMKQFMKSNGCLLYISCVNWPSSLAVERSHRTIVSLIRIILISKNWLKEKWPLCLNEVLKTMRHSPDSQTMNSPFQRCFGKESVNKLDLTISPLIPIETEYLKPLTPYPNTSQVENEFTILDYR